jgi:hypothetical protein
MAKKSRVDGTVLPGRADRETVSRDNAMTHTPSPRMLSSAIGDAQAKVARGQRRSADQDLGFRIRNDLDRALGAYSITPKHVTVLSALISFLGDQTRIVFASNRKLSARLHNLPERTLSRQVKLLVEEGFLRRVMSPNGKRWARRKEGGGIEEAFGLDLTPFFERAQEFAQGAAEAMRRETEIKVARLRVSLLRERLEELGAAPELVAEIRRERRRVPCPATLERLEHEAQAALADLGQAVDNSTEVPSESEEMATNDSHSGRHLQTRNDRVLLLDPLAADQVSYLEGERTAMRLGGNPLQRRPDHGQRREAVGSDYPGLGTSGHPAPSSPELPREPVKDLADRVLADLRRKLVASTKPTFHGSDDPRRCSRAVFCPPDAEPRQPAESQALGGSLTSPELGSALPNLDAVLEACPEALSLTAERPSTWSQLFEAAWQIGRWMQIPDNVMAKACAILGRGGLAVTLLCLCERHTEIRQPAAYLSALSKRPGFSPAELLRGKLESARPGLASGCDARLSWCPT